MAEERHNAEVEVIFLPDGSILVPRGEPDENKVLREVFSEIADTEGLQTFLDLASASQIIFGDSRLCG